MPCSFNTTNLLQLLSTLALSREMQPDEPSNADEAASPRLAAATPDTGSAMLESKVSEMELALNARLAAMDASAHELQLKESALKEANEIALKATKLMHHFKGQAEALQQQCDSIKDGSSAATLPSWALLPGTAAARWMRSPAALLSCLRARATAAARDAVFRRVASSASAAGSCYTAEQVA